MDAFVNNSTDNAVLSLFSDADGRNWGYRQISNGISRLAATNSDSARRHLVLEHLFEVLKSSPITNEQMDVEQKIDVPVKELYRPSFAKFIRTLSSVVNSSYLEKGKPIYVELSLFDNSIDFAALYDVMRMLFSEPMDEKLRKLKFNLRIHLYSHPMESVMLQLLYVVDYFLDNCKVLESFSMQYGIEEVNKCAEHFLKSFLEENGKKERIRYLGFYFLVSREFFEYLNDGKNEEEQTNKKQKTEE